MKTNEDLMYTDELIMSGEMPYGGYGIAYCDDLTAFVVWTRSHGWDHVHVIPSDRNAKPTWDEMSTIRDMFFLPEETVLQLHVPSACKSNAMHSSLHLWRPQNVDIPLPPQILVSCLRCKEHGEGCKRCLDGYGEAE